MKKIIIGTAVLLGGCIVQPARVYYPPPQYVAQPRYVQPVQPVYRPSQNEVEYQAPDPQPVVSVYVEPPLVQPEPVLVSWAPPPMLVESPSEMPYDDAVWTGGYWVWEGNWVWAHGRWSHPPRFGYGWVNPYYENRGGSVVFVNGFWSAPGVVFVPPPMGIHISVGIVAVGVVAGPPPMGPMGVFVPPPPGSHRGLIVPAPIGTSPAVVTSAPPIVRAGMQITSNGPGQLRGGANVTVIAPAGSTANGQAFNNAVPAQPHLAAGMTPMVKAYAPQPASSTPIPAYVAGRQPTALPQAQVVHPEISPAFRASVQQRGMQNGPQPTPLPGPRNAVTNHTVPLEPTNNTFTPQSRVNENPQRQMNTQPVGQPVVQQPAAQQVKHQPAVQQARPAKQERKESKPKQEGKPEKMER